MEDKDRVLIDGCRKNDRKAQFELFELYLPYVTSICKRYLRDRSFLKDVVQEVFLNIFKGIHNSYDGEKGALKYWIRSIAINSTLKFNARHKRFTILELDRSIEVRGEPDFMHDEQLLALLKAIPDKYRDVFNMYVIDELSHQEIAGHLSISESSSRKKLQRARAFLRKYFSKTGRDLYVSL